MKLGILRLKMLVFLAGVAVLLSGTLLSISPISLSVLPLNCTPSGNMATCLASADESENFYFYNSPLPAPSPLKCLAIDSNLPQYQIIYLNSDNSTSVPKDVESTIINDVQVANTILKDSSNNEREFRFSTNNDCTPNIKNISLPSNTSLDPNELVKYLNKNKNTFITQSRSTPTNLLVFVSSANNFCGQGTGLPLLLKNNKWIQDISPGIDNQINAGNQVALIGASCFIYPQVVAHELIHTLGAVSASSPNASLHGHCLDGHDLMCYADETTLTVKVSCPNLASIFTLDCNGDDYFSLNPKPESYLYTHWNTANNLFLYNLSTNNTYVGLNSAPNLDHKVTVSSSSIIEKPAVINSFKAIIKNSNLTLSWNTSTSKSKFSYKAIISSKYNNITKMVTSNYSTITIPIIRKSHDKINVSIAVLSGNAISSTLKLAISIP